MAAPKRTGSNAYPVRIHDDFKAEIDAACAAKGGISFGAFAKMAYRLQLDTWAAEKRYAENDLKAIISAWENIVKQATQTIDPVKTGESASNCKKINPPDPKHP